MTAAQVAAMKMLRLAMSRCYLARLVAAGQLVCHGIATQRAYCAGS